MIKTLKSYKINIFRLAFLFLVLIFTINFYYAPDAAAGIRKAPNFNSRVLNPVTSGFKNFQLKNFNGHVVVINFWATWCPPCRHEIPMFKNFYKSERSKGVIVVGINVNNSIGGVRSFLKQYNIMYPVVYASSEIISDYGGISDIPQTFFISKNGRLMFHWVGEISKGALYGITDKLLKMN